MAGTFREGVCDGVDCGRGAICSAVVIEVPTFVGIDAFWIWDGVTSICAGVPVLSVVQGRVKGAADVYGSFDAGVGLTNSLWVGGDIRVGPEATIVENFSLPPVGMPPVARVDEEEHPLQKGLQ